MSQARAFYGFQIAMENIHSGRAFYIMFHDFPLLLVLCFMCCNITHFITNYHNWWYFMPLLVRDVQLASGDIHQRLKREA